MILAEYTLYVNDGLASLQVLKRLHLTLILLKKELELSKLQVTFFCNCCQYAALILVLKDVLVLF